MSWDGLSPVYLHIRSRLPLLCWPRLQCRTWHQESAASEEFQHSPHLNTRSGMSLQRQTWTEVLAPPSLTTCPQGHPMLAMNEPSNPSHTLQPRHDRAQIIYSDPGFNPCMVTALSAATVTLGCRKHGIIVCLRESGKE